MTVLDQAQRQQVLNDTCNQIIHAGAGTGKTTLIVEKYMTLLAQGVSPEKIVAITFTHASADELKNRLALAYAQKFPDQPALHVGRLAIDTIHGFARSIIRGESLRLGYLPSFQSTEDQAMEELRTQTAATFVAAYQAQHPSLLIWSLLGWIKSHHIQSWLLLLSKQGRHVQVDRPGHWHWDWQPMVSCIALLYERMQTHDVPANDGAADLILHWHAWLHDIDPNTPLTWVGILDQKPIKASRKGNQKNWGDKETLAWVRQELDRLAIALEEFAQSLADHLIQTMDAMHMDFEKALSKEKKKQNWMEPDEQLTLATECLSQEATWQQWRTKVDYVFVDEFQDTDPVQTTMLWRLLAQEFSGSQPWTDIALRPGCLTVVGDPQQSIYRFRGASVEIFQQACQSIQAHGGTLYTLSQNFRSNQGVLDFVNTFFAQEDDYVPLQAMQEHASDTPATHPCPIDGVNLNGVDELRQQEARVLRAKLEQILKNNPSIEPQDCVLLLPTLSHASTYQEVLGETTPTYIYAKRGQPNALLEDILVWLGVLHLPWSKLAAWHACRLPWTYQSLQQLTQWHQQMQGLGLNKKIDDPRWQEIQALFFQHQTLLKNSCLQWAEHFVDMHRAFESSATTLMDEATLHWLIDQAYRYDTEKPSESFYTHLCQTHQLHGIAPTETTKPEGLQIMTMHQAKGLEFPVVMLGDLASGLTKTQYLYKRPYPVQVELAFSPFRSWLKTDHFDSLAQEEKKALMQEKKRLLYVAMTRAKTHLLYPTTDFAARGATFYDFFAT